MKLLPMLVLSSGSVRKILKEYPSNRSSPSFVPNQRNPRLSCRLQMTALFERPFSTCRWRKYQDCPKRAGPTARARRTNMQVLPVITANLRFFVETLIRKDEGNFGRRLFLEVD